VGEGSVGDGAINKNLALSNEKYPSLALALLFACISLRDFEIEFGNS
jgi:hypothetical protein